MSFFSLLIFLYPNSSHRSFIFVCVRVKLGGKKEKNETAFQSDVSQVICLSSDQQTKHKDLRIPRTRSIYFIRLTVCMVLTPILCVCLKSLIDFAWLPLWIWRIEPTGQSNWLHRAKNRFYWSSVKSITKSSFFFSFLFPIEKNFI